MTESSPSPTPIGPRRRCPTADWSSSPGVGHFPHAEAPERFAHALVDFIESTEPSELSSDDLGRVLRERAETGGYPQASTG